MHGAAGAALPLTNVFRSIRVYMARVSSVYAGGSAHITEGAVLVAPWASIRVRTAVFRKQNLARCAKTQVWF